jgi:hypothetical protein
MGGRGKWILILLKPDNEMLSFGDAVNTNNGGRVGAVARGWLQCQN